MDYLINKATLTAMADALRKLTNSTGNFGGGEIAPVMDALKLGVDFSNCIPSSFTKVYSGSFVAEDDLSATDRVIGNIGRENVPSQDLHLPGLFVFFSPDYSYSESSETVQCVFFFSYDLWSVVSKPKGFFRIGGYAITNTSGNYVSGITGGNFDSEGNVIPYGFYDVNRPLRLGLTGDVSITLGPVGRSSTRFMAGKMYHWFLLT